MTVGISVAELEAAMEKFYADIDVAMAGPSSLRCHLTQGLDYTTDTVDRSPRWPCSYCGHSVAGHRDCCDNCGGPREDE